MIRKYLDERTVFFLYELPVTLVQHYRITLETFDLRGKFDTYQNQKFFIDLKFRPMWKYFHQL